MTAPNTDTLRDMLEYLTLSRITPGILVKQKELGAIDLLLDKDSDAAVTEAVAVRALELGGEDYLYARFRRSTLLASTLVTLWERNSSLVVTQSLLQAARSPDGLDFLLQRWGPATEPCRTLLHR